MPRSFAAASVTAVETRLVTGLLPEDSIETRGMPVRPFSRTAAACREKSLGIVTTASYFPLFRPSRAVSRLTTSQAMRRAWEDSDAAPLVRLAIICRPAGRVLPELSLAGSSRLTTAALAGLSPSTVEDVLAKARRPMIAGRTRTRLKNRERAFFTVFSLSDRSADAVRRRVVHAV